MSDVLLILKQCALRHWRLAWRQQLMLLVLLALGTAVHVAMRLANESALAGFSRFTTTITKDSDWTLRAQAGPLKEAWLREMRAKLGARPVTLLPVIEATVVPHREQAASIGSRPTWRLIGMDWIALQNLARERVQQQASSLGGDQVLCSAAMAKREGWSVDGSIALVINDEVKSVKLAGVFEGKPDQPAPPDDALLMDLPLAQRFISREGEVDRVEVLAPEGPAFPRLREEAREMLSGDPRWQVLSREDRRNLASSMTAAFRLNLTILSLLALFVGGYLMFQALEGVVIRRREEIAILRALGITASSVKRAFLIEAALLGLIAGVLGIALGWLAAQGAVLAVARTMTALYGASSATFAELPLHEALIGIGLCVLTSLAAAWWPARNAAATLPAAVLSKHGSPWVGGALWRAEWIGGVLMLIAVGLSQLDVLRMDGARVPLAAYAAALLWLLGAALAAGALLRVTRSPHPNPLPSRVEDVAVSPMGEGTTSRVAHRTGAAESPSPTGECAVVVDSHWERAGVRASLRNLLHSTNAARDVAFSHLRMPSVRHRFAIAALVSAIAMSTGMAIMIASFDHTMRSWIVRSMKADIYLASAGAQSASSTDMIRASTVDRIATKAGVAEIATIQHATFRLPDGPVHLLGVNVTYATAHDVYAWVHQPASDWSLRDEALINESLSTRLNVATGDTLEVPTPSGPQRVRIAGIYADYGNEMGSVTVPQSKMQQWFENRDAWRVAIMLKPGTDPETLRAELQREHPGLSVFTQSHLRSEALRIFQQTFAVTYALEAVGVVVAVAGLGLALACLLLDRRADLVTLRSIGFTSRDVARACAWEGTGLALAGVIVGIGSGVWLGWLLIARVNKQAFGWTLSFALPWAQLFVLGAAVLTVGALVSAGVGRWAAKLKGEQEA